MLRSSLFAATSVFVLSACQPAAEAPTDTVVADTPPPVAEDVVETAADVPEIVDAAVTEETGPAADPDADHEDDGHDHDDDGEHDEHDHDEDHGDHDHEDEHDDHDHDEHDHDDHDHAGGEAHVHGLTDMAVAIDGNSVSVSFDGALANFDLDESIRTLEDTSSYTDGVVTLVGGDCAQEDAVASIRPIGDHGNLMIDLTYTCSAIETLEGIDVIAFERFSGFETVNAVILNETDQSASTLTAESDRIDLR